MIEGALESAIARDAGSAVLGAHRIAGGDVSHAYRVELADGRSLFVKSHRSPPPGMYGLEVRGLLWLREAAALAVPEVVCVSDVAPAYLALGFIESGSGGGDFAEQLGRGLAALHGANAQGFGLAYDSYVAVIAQPNRPCDDWPSFYAERRLEPMLARAVSAGRAPRPLRIAVDRVIDRIRRDPEGACGPAEPPARLHGDLWSGNVIVDPVGRPCLIDPAVYGGHREVDLAMMRLFGGFSDRCFDAYHEAAPLAPGHAERVGLYQLYQLYPLLVHVALFGRSYVGRTVELAARLG